MDERDDDGRLEPNRRTFLAGTAAAGAGAVSTGLTAGAEDGEPNGAANDGIPDPAPAPERRGPHTGRPPARGDRGMVATPHWLATAAGNDALRNGGSAVDAAIAANAVLSVAYPHMSGLGGDAFWLIHDGNDVRALNASGPAAANATRERFAEYDELPDRGPESALTVPGAVDGWRRAHEAYGGLAWEELFGDAIRHAREGVPVGHSLADWLEIDEPILREFPDTAEIFLPDGDVPEEGDRLVQTALADSLETLATEGAREGFYDGPIAEELASPEGSPLTSADFADFEADWVEPISTTYRGYTAYNFPPNTQGFAALQVLNLLEGFDIESWGDGTADYYHHMAEAVKVAFADRDEWLTDPDHVDIPLETLLSKEYADERRGRIDAESAMEMDDVEPGIEFGGSDRDIPGGDTVYLTAVDDDGLAVSLIQSVYYDFGSAVVGGDSGIILQNRGSFFSLDEDHPNRLEPGKRTFHTLIPAILCKDGEPYLCYGTMGGEGQPQTQAAMVTRLVDFDYDVQQAIETPRWLMGPTWGTDDRDLSLEGRVDDAVIDELAARGQPTTVLDDWDDNMGHAQAIRIDPETGYLEGGADPRGDGSAQGF
ncbi:gamma-glutamyltransferase [Natronococcus occultus]|uniref:Gamma-glutamyltransferase 2 n=1 Tax=Natronococcus occultus SP4 TaxID=694430 RepID=L0K3X5_9EURY|nr:gamma-glutamyltransferase [Natronococcus occultus]AGB39064.1 gamma-glutamyltransferase 2 [Natronococcus occultus SP4]